MRSLAIHQITFLPGGPAGLIEFASQAELQSVCLFTATPIHPDGTPMFPVVSPAEKIEMRSRLSNRGITVTNAEYFLIAPDIEVRDYRVPLELAAELGAKRAVTHIHEPQSRRAEDQLGQLCETAADLGLDIGLEFTGFAKGCDSLKRAVALHGKMAQDNLFIAVDALHLFRTGGTIEALAAIEPKTIGYAQICDGLDLRVTEDYLEEAMSRMVPGEGIFPLPEFLGVLGEHVDVDIEVPCTAMPPDCTSEKWAMLAVAASKNLLR
ncbi:TIM barrel protein [Parasphingorhabdus sp.]|uniref:sugar phosphate isomerase/epimerase family protein n=1 Tax=Parasphingorhabdus sp. TaxID=2709688 RepID=UPI003264D43E